MSVMSPSIAKRRWHELKKVFDSLKNEEFSLTLELADKRRESDIIVMELQRLALLIIKGGETIYD